MAMVKHYGDDALLDAAARTCQFMEAGDMVGCTTWQRILDAIERLQAQKPAEGEKVVGVMPRANVERLITSW
jgi:hypothetical protein